MKELDSNLAAALETLARAVEGCADADTAEPSDAPAVLLQAARTLERQGERIGAMRRRMALLNQGFSDDRILGIHAALTPPGSPARPREELLAFARALFAAQASQGL